MRPDRAVDNPGGATMLDTDPAAKTPPVTDPMVSPLRAGLRGHCPRCGKGALFDGFLKIAQ